MILIIIHRADPENPEVLKAIKSKKDEVGKWDDKLTTVINHPPRNSDSHIKEEVAFVQYIVLTLLKP